MSDYMIKRVTTEPKIEIQNEREVVSANGDNILRQITINDRRSGSETKVDARHLFVCIGGKPNTEWARDTAILRDSGGYLVTGTDMYVDGKPPERWPLGRSPMFLETSVPGSFAAGDERRTCMPSGGSASPPGRTARRG